MRIRLFPVLSEPYRVETVPSRYSMTEGRSILCEDLPRVGVVQEIADNMGHGTHIIKRTFADRLVWGSWYTRQNIRARRARSRTNY